MMNTGTGRQRGPHDYPGSRRALRRSVGFVLALLLLMQVGVVVQAQDGAIRITAIAHRGDITLENVVLENTGSASVDLTGWSLQDEDGNAYIFPAFTLRGGALVRVYTRTGQDTPRAFYWNLDAPVWRADESATLLDADGDLQAVYPDASAPSPTARAVAPVAVAGIGMTANDDWQPYSQTFNGVEMVLVPAGTFVMGSTDDEMAQALELCNRYDEDDNCASDPFEREAPAH